MEHCKKRPLAMNTIALVLIFEDDANECTRLGIHGKATGVEMFEFVSVFHEGRDDVNGNGKDDGGVFLGGNGVERLEIAQL